MGDTDRRVGRDIKGVWRGRGQVREPRRQDMHEWRTQEARRKGMNGGLERQNRGIQERREEEERVHGKEAWRKRVEGFLRWPFRVESYRLMPRLET